MLTPKKLTFQLEFILILLTIPTTLFCQYARVYGGANNERAYALSEGLNPATDIWEYVIAGWTQSYNPRPCPLVIGVSRRNGAFDWGLIANDTGQFYSIVKTNDGYALTGYICQLGPGNTGADVIVAKVNANGEFQWGKIYKGPADDFGHSIIKTQDGGFAVCGWTYSFGADPKPNILVLKLDSIGTLQWSKAIWFTGTVLGKDQGFGIIELPYYPNYPNMRYAIVGKTQIQDTLHYDAFVMTLNTFGNPMWVKTFLGDKDDEAYSVVVSYDTLTIAGWTNSVPDTLANIFLANLLAYDGSPIWYYTYGHSNFSDKVGDDNCLALNTPITSYPYRYLISGWTTHTPGPAGSADFLYLAVLANGTLYWARRHPSSISGTPQQDEGYSVLRSLADRIVITGWSNNDAFTQAEDFHLLSTPLSGFNRVCTARDTLVRDSFMTPSPALIDTALFGMNIENFTMDRVTVPVRSFCAGPTGGTGWIPLPPGFELKGTKPIKSGGSITAIDHYLFALTGNNTRDLQRIVLIDDEPTWSIVDSVPLGSKNKRVKKGACMIDDDPTWIYILKGNGTNEFYRYNIQGKGWEVLEEPGFTKGVKGGFMTLAKIGDTKYIYAGSGSNTNEWKRFNLSTLKWEPCKPETLPGGKWKIGSSMAFGDSFLYLLRAKTNEFFRLKLSPQPDPPDFERRASLPLENREGKRKKVKEGGSLVTIIDPDPPPTPKGVEPTPWFAIKAGNTREFWRYDPVQDQWTQLADVPSKKPIKAGGCLTYSRCDNAIYCLIGNNTNELWAIIDPDPPPKTSLIPELSSSAMDRTLPKELQLFNFSNPNRGEIKIAYNLPQKIKVSLKVYNIAGKKVYESSGDCGFFIIKELPAGIYILRMTADGYKAERKVIVVR